MNCIFIGGSKDGDREDIKPFIQLIQVPVTDQSPGSVDDPIDRSSTFHQEFYKVLDIKDADGTSHVVAVLSQDGGVIGPLGRLLQHYNPKGEVAQLQSLVEDYKIALADAVRRPMGVLPASAEGLVSEAEVMEAEQRRTIQAIPR